MRNLYDKVEARLARGGLRGPRKRPDQCGVHELDVPGHKFLTHFDGSIKGAAALGLELEDDPRTGYHCVTKIEEKSPLAGVLDVGGFVLRVDDEDVAKLPSRELSQKLSDKSAGERTLAVAKCSAAAETARAEREVAGRAAARVNYRRAWRARKAIGLLCARYGGVDGVRRRAFAAFVLVMTLVALAATEALGVTRVWEDAHERLAATISGAVVITALAAPVARLFHRSAHDTGTSRGDAIFEQARGVKDRLGFLTTVKRELDELYAFMRAADGGCNLVIVPFVDDLDRVSPDKAMRVLEAMQLLLSVPGARACGARNLLIPVLFV